MFLEPRLWEFTRGVRLRIAGAVAIGVAASLVGIGRLASLGWLIARVFDGAGFSDLILPFAAVAAMMVLRGRLEHARTMVAHRTAAKVQLVLRRRLHDHLIALGPAHFGFERTGDVLLSLVDGVEQLEIYFGEYLPQLLVAVIVPLPVFALLAFLDLPVAALLLAFAALALFAPSLFHRWDAANSKRRSIAWRGFAAELLDALQGIATLKAFGQSGARGELLARRAHEVSRSTLWILATNAMTRGISDTAIAVGSAALIGFGAWRVSQGQMETTTLLIVLMTGIEVFRPQRDLRAMLHNGMTGQAAAQGILSILDAKAKVEPPTKPVTLAKDFEPAIEFEGVSFAYPGGRRSAHQGLSFRIGAGERVGFVGESGAGKSTVVRLLLRFFDPDEGSVRLGGHDLRTLAPADIHRHIAVVSQDVRLFHATVEENLRFGNPDAAPEEIEAAARAANALDFIRRLPQGKDTVVGERGIRLSGGQRQRIAIARALLKNAPILILDEALSAVDAQNEALIVQALDRLMEGRTTLIFAHRLSSVIATDRIAVLERGAITESGRHHDLMRAGGTYFRLMGAQAEESEPDSALPAEHLQPRPLDADDERAPSPAEPEAGTKPSPSESAAPSAMPVRTMHRQATEERKDRSAISLSFDNEIDAHNRRAPPLPASETPHSNEAETHPATNDPQGHERHAPHLSPAEAANAGKADTRPSPDETDAQEHRAPTPSHAEVPHSNEADTRPATNDAQRNERHAPHLSPAEAANAGKANTRPSSGETDAQEHRVPTPSHAEAPHSNEAETHPAKNDAQGRKHHAPHLSSAEAANAGKADTRPSPDEADAQEHRAPTPSHAEVPYSNEADTRPATNDPQGHEHHAPHLSPADAANAGRIDTRPPLSEAEAQKPGVPPPSHADAPNPDKTDAHSRANEPEAHDRRTPPPSLGEDPDEAETPPILSDAVLRARDLGWAGAFRALLAHVIPWRWRLLVVLLLGLVRVASLIGIGVMSALAVVAVKQGEPWIQPLIVLAVIAPLAGVLHWLESWLAHDMAFRMLADMRIALYRKIDRLAPAWLVRRHSGDLVATATSDVELVEYFFAHTIAPFFVAVLVPAAVIGTLWHFSMPLALALVPFLALVAISPFLARRRIDIRGSLAREAFGEMNIHAVDTIQSLAEIISFERALSRAEEFAALNRQHHRLRLSFFSDLAKQKAILEVATGLGGLVVIMVGAWQVEIGALQDTALPLLTLLAMAAFLPISEIAHIGRQLADTLGATRRLHAVHHEVERVQDGPGANPTFTPIEASREDRKTPASKTGETEAETAGEENTAAKKKPAPEASETPSEPSQPAKQKEVSATAATATPEKGSKDNGIEVKKSIDIGGESKAPIAAPPRPRADTGLRIDIEQAFFSYPGSEKNALENISLSVDAGQTVAIVGPSGSGKTTLAHLLMRFWDPDSGRILLGGEDLRDFRLDALREEIALVTQDVWLFNETLRSNIALARPDAAPSEIEAAVRQASLDTFVESLPQGLDTRVGERGAQLSGGQRQRVAIARAFLKDAPVLILDEATSHLDAINEQSVRHTLDALMTTRTTIVIAHRLSTVRNADRIAVLEQGHCVETGTHQELIAQKGAYLRLIEYQRQADRRIRNI